MVSRKVIIKNPTGLHLRPAGLLCNLANMYRSSIRFMVGTEEDVYNAKSIICVLGAGVKCGDEITLICDGPDEQEAVDTIIARIEAGLEE